jgi:CRP/FNR family nitrogen fixation transcriptional regulator
MMRAAASTRAETDAARRAFGTVQHFAPHQTIFAEGEPAARFMLVIHGMVRSCSTFADGRRFIGAFYGAGDMFGLERNLAYLASAEAVCETAVVLYAARDWVDVDHAKDNLSQQIFGAMMRGADQARCHARLLGRLRAIEKISAFLLECHERSTQGTLITLEMTRQDIADYLGLTVETVSRCLAQLKHEGLIMFHSARQLDLRDIAKLRAISG